MKELIPNDTWCQNGASTEEVPVIPQLKRHAVQVLLQAGHSQAEVARLTGVAVRTVGRVGSEAPVTDTDDASEREKRKVGRPSIAEPYREFVRELLEKEPALLSVEILRRAKNIGYMGAKTAMYRLTADLRPRDVEVGMRFEGLPGEFSQHDFGQVDVRYTDGRVERVHFFASRLKWSRWAIVTLVGGEGSEILVRTLADHFVAFGGMPLCAVFDRPKTVALRWKKNGEVEEWNPTFAYAAMEIGFTAEVCWPYQPRQKGSVEAIVKWVKGSFFKQRRFHDPEDLRAQLAEWLTETNTERPSRATSIIPAERLKEDRERLRPLRIPPEQLSLRFPVQVSVTAEVSYEGRHYSMPPEAASLAATLYLYREHIHIVAGRFSSTHPRNLPPGGISRLPEHRAAHLAAISGQRGKRYLKRQQIFEVGEAAVSFLTEIVHRRPRGWIAEVDALHTLLQSYGAEKLERAFRAAVQSGAFELDYVRLCLGVETVVAEPSMLFEEVNR